VINKQKLYKQTCLAHNKMQYNKDNSLYKKVEADIAEIKKGPKKK
jgi:hypothetical protein